MRFRVGFLALAGVTTVAAATAVLAGSAGAVHDVIIEFEVVRGEPGEVIEIASEEVEPWLQGESCAIAVETSNNESVHLGTDLLIASGTDSVTVLDVETAPGLVTFAEGELVFGDTVAVSVQLGQDGVTSGGVRVDFLCDQQQPTTTTGPPSTTAEVSPSSTTPPTTTTIPQAAVAAAVEAQPDFTG